METTFYGLPIIHNKPISKIDGELSEVYIYMMENNPNSYQDDLVKLINNQWFRVRIPGASLINRNIYMSILCGIQPLRDRV